MGTLSSTNPLFVRLTKNARWPSLRMTLLLTIGVGLLSTLLVSCWLPDITEKIAGAISVELSCGRDRYTLAPIASTFLVLVGIVFVLTPFVLMFISISMTTNEVEDKEDFQQLCLSLNPRVLVHGLMLAILYRARILLALSIVLAPFLVIAAYDETLLRAVSTPYYCYRFMTPKEFNQLIHSQAPLVTYSVDNNEHQCAPISDPRFFLKAILRAVELAAISWGFGLWGAALGLCTALVFRRKGITILIVLVTVLLMLLVALTIAGPVIGMAILLCSADGCNYFVTWPPDVAELLWLLVPYILAGGCTLLARFWVWRSRRLIVQTATDLPDAPR